MFRQSSISDNTKTGFMHGERKLNNIIVIALEMKVLQTYPIFTDLHLFLSLCQALLEFDHIIKALYHC